MHIKGTQFQILVHVVLRTNILGRIPDFD